ncbi:hypothetical protein I3760_07G075800 [Carya illinoinensis]|nr:hypothetical protein I3760_07G075800 [Carya illinoinensis]
MSNAFQRYKGQCHAHYQKFSTTTEARQNPFHAIPPNEWEKVCDLFEDSAYQQGKNPVDYDLTKLYAKVHKNRNGVWSNPEVEANYDKMKSFKDIAADPSDESSFNDA